MQLQSQLNMGKDDQTIYSVSLLEFSDGLPSETPLGPAVSPRFLHEYNVQTPRIPDLIFRWIR
jgi:hypothetical protein